MLLNKQGVCSLLGGVLPTKAVLLTGRSVGVTTSRSTSVYRW